MATTKRNLTDPRVQGQRPAGRTASQQKAKANSLPQLLTVQEVAEILRVPPEYVTRRLVFERRIQFIKVGRRTLFDPVDVENFLAERTVTPAE